MMAVTETDIRDQIRVEYKTDYDTTGDFPTLDDFQQTFSYVKENATLAQKKAYADALMTLTVYKGAPYVVKLISTGELVVE